MRILLTIRSRFPNSIPTPYEKPTSLATNEAWPGAARTPPSQFSWRAEEARTQARPIPRGRAATDRQAARPRRRGVAPRRRADDRGRAHRARWREADHSRDAAGEP